MSTSSNKKHCKQMLAFIGFTCICLARLTTISGEQHASEPSQVNVASQIANQAAANSQAIAQQQQQQQQQPLVKLPKINVYISRSEIKKLLGLQTRLDYVTNGIINTYPLEFTIPLGFNQSDMIFTWQNLGQTNVNYSISLVIGNIQAVDAPLINITRSGLIPKQEQEAAQLGSVFKITLPCSGSVTDEVDVQVLINIAGYVEIEPDLALASASDLLAGSISPGSQSAASLEQSTASAANLSSQDTMQSDQATDFTGPKTRLVAHTLVIKRKKICTMHPVQVAPPVQPQTRPTPVRVSDYATPPQRAFPTLPPFRPAQFNPAWRGPTSGPSPSSSSGEATVDNQQTVGGNNKTRHATPSSGSNDRPEPASSLLSSRNNNNNNNNNNNLAHDESGAASFVVSSPAHLPGFNSAQPPLLDRAPIQNQIGRAAPFGRDDPASWPPYLAALPEGNPLNEIAPPSAKRQPSVGAQPATGNNPLVLTLIALSMIVSLALVVVVLLSGLTHKQAPLNKLSAISRCLLRRAPASVGQSGNKCKSPMANAVISSLRADPKSTANSVVSTISGQSNSARTKQANYCFKTTCHNGYYTTGGNASGQFQQQQQQQQHHYQQHPPTADLLGTGYQCQPSQQQQHHHHHQQTAAHFPIYHLANGNNSQTTRLIWNNGNGTSPDGFRIDGGTYMPLSNAARSDSGSVYQTIY